MDNVQFRSYCEGAETVEIRSLGDGRRTVRGYAAVFNKRSRVLTEKGRRFVEVIEPGAFEGTDFSDAEARFNHDARMLLATYPNTLTLAVDSRGLVYEYEHDATDPDHASVFAKINRRSVVGSSFMFSVDPKDEVWTRDGDMAVRSIRRVKKVWDVGPVARPAYPDTTVFARSLDAVFSEGETVGERDGEGGADVGLVLARTRVLTVRAKLLGLCK